MLTRRRFVLNTAALRRPRPRLAKPASPWRKPANVYRNPILGGDHPDASPIRVGDDFYLTHSSFDYAPGLLIWHSRDLVNWRPVAAALHRYYGTVWAPYLCEYQGRFYIYFPADGSLRVVHAEHPTGPWSEPIDLGINAIDPAHIAENGRRFLYMAGGLMAELTADGLAVKTPPRKVLDPWPMPATTRMECTCLEGPKLIEHNGWFYLNVAEGGTAGPAPATRVVSARSRHADGPWEFSPYNPIVHTDSRDDRWLSLGHGRLVDTPDGKWYITVHSYENGYRTLGRQLMLLPIEWTADGWFRVPAGVTADSAIPMPIPGTSQQPFLDPSDDFTSAELGLQWAFWHEFDPARFTTGNGALTLEARGKSLADTSRAHYPRRRPLLHRRDRHRSLARLRGRPDALLRSQPRRRHPYLARKGSARATRQWLRSQPPADKAQPAPPCASSMTARRSISITASPARVGKRPRNRPKSPA